MAFTDYGGAETNRYATWAEAQLGHNRMVEAIRARLRERALERATVTRFRKI